jgi:hypothetical protein
MMAIGDGRNLNRRNFVRDVSLVNNLSRGKVPVTVMFVRHLNGAGLNYWSSLNWVKFSKLNVSQIYIN